MIIVIVMLVIINIAFVLLVSESQSEVKHLKALNESYKDYNQIWRDLAEQRLDTIAKRNFEIVKLIRKLQKYGLDKEK